MVQRFTLLDDAYYDALRRVVEALEHEGLPYCLVGGGAAQAWIASLRTGAGARRLSDEPTLSGSLRKTRDLDFSTRVGEPEMLAILNRLAALHGDRAHVMGPRVLRLGGVSLSFTLEPADLSGMASLYDVFLASRTMVRLRRGRVVDEVPTIGLEALLATKLTRRGDKAKDVLDVTELLASARDADRAVDLDVVRGLVQGQTEAITLLDEIAERIQEEEQQP